MTPTQPVPGRAQQGKCCPQSLVLGSVANVAAFAAGAVFMLAEPGSRFRGMEPQAIAFICLGGMSILMGLFLVLPIALLELYRGECVRRSSLAVLLALTPWPLATVISQIIGEILGLNFDS